MSALIEPISGAPPLDHVARRLRGEVGVTFLRSGDSGHRSQRLTILAARPMLSMRVKGAVVETALWRWLALVVLLVLAIEWGIRPREGVRA